MVFKPEEARMLYFSKKHVDIDDIDLDQYQGLKSFKSSIRDKGIQDEYKDIHELKEKLSRHMTIVLREMSTGPVIDKRVVEAAKASTRDTAAMDTSATSSASPADAEKPYLEKYTERSFIIRGGDTVPVKDKLTKQGGKWISVNTGGKAWMFSNRHLAAVAKILKIKPDIRDKLVL